MSRLLPADLQTHILSFIPLVQLQPFLPQIPDSLLCKLLFAKYNIAISVSTGLFANKILNRVVQFNKIATLMGDSTYAQQLYFDLTYVIIRAIINNDFGLIDHYFSYYTNDGNIKMMMFLSLAVIYTDKNTFNRIFSYELSSRILTQFDKPIDRNFYHKFPKYFYPSILPLTDETPPLCKKLNVVLSKRDPVLVDEKLYDAVSSLDLGALHAIDLKLIYQDEERKIPAHAVRTVISALNFLPLSLFEQLPLLQKYVEQNFVSSLDLTTYLDSCNILLNKNIDLTKYDPKEDDDIGNNFLIIAISVLADQINQIVEYFNLDISNFYDYIIPSERLYNLSFYPTTNDKHNEVLLMSIWICNYQSKIYGLNYTTDIEKQYLQLVEQDKTNEATLLARLEPDLNMFLNPKEVESKPKTIVWGADPVKNKTYLERKNKVDEYYKFLTQ